MSRSVRIETIDSAGLIGRADAIAELHGDRLDALVVRGAFPEALRRGLVTRAGDDALPWQRPNRTGPSADIRVLGVAATPTFETPGGPPPDAYFDAAERFEGFYGDVPRTIETLLARASGGRPVHRLARPDGRAFAACTMRTLPEGQRIIVHNDFFHFQLPVYQDVVAGLDTSTSLSYLVLLQAPESGGELMIHGLAQQDPTPRLPNGFPDGAAIARDFPATPAPMAAGDLLLFAAGRLYHHVAPVVGAQPRVTLGGFLTFDEPHEAVVYWN